MTTFSAYEHAEAGKITARKHQVEARPQNRLERVAQETGQKAVEGVRKIPHADKALELASGAYGQAVEGLGKAMSTTALLTLSNKRLVKRFARRDPSVTSMADIRALDLSVIDAVRPRGLIHRSAASAGAGGMLSGAAMAGGTIVAAGGSIFGAGAGAAPGFGVAAGAFAADTATVLVTSTRLTAEIGMYYGYDPTDEYEQLFHGAVLSYGTAAGTAAKNAAYADLFRLTQMLARKAAVDSLNKSALSKILQPLFKALTLRLTKAKLGQIVPVAGIVVGAGMNYAMIEHVGQTAHWAYRERFLRDKGYPFVNEPGPSSAPAEEDAEADDDPVISIFQIADETDVDLTGTESSTSPN